MLHLQKIIRGPLNVLADLVAVRRTMDKRAQDEHVKRALKKAMRCCVSFSWKTFDPPIKVIVDIRPPIVKGLVLALVG